RERVPPRRARDSPERGRCSSPTGRGRRLSRSPRRASREGSSTGRRGRAGRGPARTGCAMLRRGQWVRSRENLPGERREQCPATEASQVRSDLTQSVGRLDVRGGIAQRLLGGGELAGEQGEALVQAQDLLEVAAAGRCLDGQAATALIEGADRHLSAVLLAEDSSSSVEQEESALNLPSRLLGG